MNKLSLIFPGQGSQYVGMGQWMYDKHSFVRDIYQEANDIVGFDLVKLSFEGDINELSRTENTQPALLTYCYAAYQLYKYEGGYSPHWMLGHSLGELSALTCAEAITFSDAIQISRIRGQLMAKVGEEMLTKMFVVRGVHCEIVEKEIEKNVAESVYIANYNAPKQTVIVGKEEDVEKISHHLITKGAEMIPLLVSSPSHTPFLESIREQFYNKLSDFYYKEPKYPVLSNVNAKPYQDINSIVKNLSDQLINPVLWHDCMLYLQTMNVGLAIEIGPKAVLRNLVRNNYPHIEAYSIDKQEEHVHLYKSMRNIPTVLTQCIKAAICTKNNNPNDEEYNIGVIQPYRYIYTLQKSLEKEGKWPTKNQMKQAIDMLISVFKCKQVPYEERLERIQDIIDITHEAELFDYYLQMK